MAKQSLPTGNFSLLIGGKERQGRIDMAALCRIETESGVSVLDALSKGLGKWGMNVTCVVLYVGLSACNEKITKEHITTWIQNAVDDGDAKFIDFVLASQRAVMTSMGRDVRTGVRSFEEKKLVDVDAKGDQLEGEGDGQADSPLPQADDPVADGPKKKLRTA